MYRLFKVKGTSMSPVLKDSRFVIGESVDRFSVSKNDVVVDSRKGRIKRVYSINYKKVHLCGVNNNSSSYIASVSDISHKIVWPKL